MIKSITWRLLGVLCLWIISYIFTGSIPCSTFITFVHHSVFLFIYWLHERIWLRYSRGHGTAIIKAFTYEIVIAIPVLSLISWIFTGDPFKALTISVVYTTFKLFLYVIFEEAWEKYVSKPVIYLDMVADLFHIGHLNAIREAARRGIVVVGLLTDEGAAEYKRKPIIPYNQRLEILYNIKGVHRVMMQENLTTSVIQNIKSCGADFFLHGDDWNHGVQQKRKQFLIKNGIQIIEIPYTEGISTTKILKKLD